LPSEKLAHFSQPNRWDKQENEPGDASDITRDIADQEPGDGGDREDDYCRDAPTAKPTARPPRSQENEQGRDDRDEQEDVIEIHGSG
jgi:hypothetical protein